MKINNQKKQYTLYNFLPLIIIFSCIIILTLISQWYRAPSFHGAMSDFMGFFFLIFGLFKISNWSNFADAYQMYDIIAKKNKLYAYLYPIIEICLGIAYLFRWHLGLINIITLIIMLISSIGVAKELLAGREVTCACLGAVFKIPMTWVTLVEDLLMAVMALFMIL